MLAELAATGIAPPGSFEAVAREWFAKNQPTWAASLSEKIIRRLERDVFPWIGKQAIGSIKPGEILALLKRVQERGAIETTHRIQQNCGQVFRYAVATGRQTAIPVEICAARCQLGSGSITRRSQTPATWANSFEISIPTKAASSSAARSS